MVSRFLLECQFSNNLWNKRLAVFSKRLAIFCTIENMLSRNKRLAVFSQRQAVFGRTKNMLFVIKRLVVFSKTVSRFIPECQIKIENVTISLTLATTIMTCVRVWFMPKVWRLGFWEGNELEFGKINRG